MVAALHEALFGIDARWYADGPPSGRNYVRHLLEALAAGDDATEFGAFAHGKAVRDIRQLGLRVLPTPAFPSLAFNLIGIPLRTPRSMRAVLHQNFTPPWSGTRSATVVHDLIFLRRPEQFSRSELAYLSLIPRLLPRAAVVVTVSEHVKTEILERWPERESSSVIVAPNGIDDALLETARNDPAGWASSQGPGASSAHHESGRPYVLYLGRLNRRKNLVRLVQAFAASRLVDHDLLLAGPDDGAAREIRDAIRQTDTSGRVRLLGLVPDGEIRRLIAGADAFAYISLDEGFGVPPLEAMAVGVPVVASDIPALRETAGGGGAILVSPRDVEQIAVALRRAVEDGAFRERARMEGPAHARSYRWSTTACQVRLALEQAAA